MSYPGSLELPDGNFPMLVGRVINIRPNLEPGPQGSFGDVRVRLKVPLHGRTFTLGRRTRH
jgi:hypothetical protein